MIPASPGQQGLVAVEMVDDGAIGVPIGDGCRGLQEGADSDVPWTARHQLKERTHQVLVDPVIAVDKENVPSGGKGQAGIASGRKPTVGLVHHPNPTVHGGVLVHDDGDVEVVRP